MLPKHPHREAPRDVDDAESRIYLIRQIADEEIEPVDEWSGIRVGSGVEAPGTVENDGPRPVVRSFAFLDLCESTAFFEETGPREALAIVSAFRATVRDVCARRGVRVAKWIGDGAMLVSVADGPVIAACVEICDRMRDAELRARGGVSVSVALPFDGDDYLARGANFAARLCDIAEPGEVLCDIDCAVHIPAWVQRNGERSVDVRGMGSYTVLSLAVIAPGV